MSLQIKMKHWLLVLFSVFIVACSSNQTKDSAESSSMQESSALETAGTDSVGAIEESSKMPKASFDQLQTVVYFGFDRSVITPASKQALDELADFMKASNVSLRLEGHTDERGSREYNMALGERRGQAVKDYLVAKGVPSSRLEVISYGEEKPAVRASNESAYAKNRRVEVKK